MTDENGQSVDWTGRIDTPDFGEVLNGEYGRECPVCGERVLWTEKIPENPDPNNKPHCRGVGFVHDAEEKARHKAKITKMCEFWEDGTSDHWLENQEVSVDD